MIAHANSGRAWPLAVTEWITPEDTPVITIFRADLEGVVDVYMDSTRNADFGSGEWGVSACESVTFERGGAQAAGLSIRTLTSDIGSSNVDL